MRFLLLALLLVSFEAGAATWHVRPDFTYSPAGAIQDQNYGAEDGSSYAAAFDGFADITWGVGGVQSGDTLKLYGTFYERFTLGGSGVTLEPQADFEQVAAASYNGTNTFTAGTPVVLNTTGSSWQLVSGEVYKKGAATEIYLMQQDGQPLSPRIYYTDTESNVAAGLARGEFTVRNATTDSLSRTVYVRTTDGAPPDSHLITVNRRDWDNLSGAWLSDAKDNWTISSRWTLKYHYNNSSSASGSAVVIQDSDGWSADFYLKDNYFAAWVDGGSNGSWDGEIVGGQQGLALTGFTSALVDIEVTGNFHDVCEIPRYNGLNKTWNTDCDCVGIGHTGGTMTRGRIHNATFNRCGPQRLALLSDEAGDLNRGSSVYLGTSNAFAADGLIIENNWISASHRYLVFIGDEATNYSIRGNILHDGLTNPAFTTTGLVRLTTATAGATTVTVANNHFVNNDGITPLYFGTANASAAYTIKNNVFAFNSGGGGTFNGNFHRAVTTSSTSESNNLFWSPAETTIVRSESTNYSTVAAWQAASSQGAGDLNASPAFVGNSFPLSAEEFKPRSNSPLIRAGTCYLTTGCVARDFGGRRARVPPDIGAWQRRASD